jgi:hypothetical protein
MYILVKEGKPIFLGDIESTRREYRKHQITDSRPTICNVQLGRKCFGIIRPLSDYEQTEFLKRSISKNPTQQDLFKGA